MLICIMLTSCAIDNDSESPWEAELRNDLQAESVKVSQVDPSTSSDGTVSTEGRYWQLVIINSKVLKPHMGDEKLLSKKCDEIKERMRRYEATGTLPFADTLRIVMIQSSNFLIFHSTHHKTVTCYLHGTTHH